MEYYGKANSIRVMEVFSETIGEERDQIVFMKEKNIFGEYLYEKMERALNGSCPELVCQTLTNVDYFKGNHETVTYKDTVFYVDECKGTNKRRYLVEIPKFTNDEKFYWKGNDRYGVKECTLEYGPFQMFCILKADDEVTVEIKYTKCENKHRNNVTIATIDIYDGSNEVIKEAIEKWARDFAEDFILAGFKSVLLVASKTNSDAIKEKREWRKEELLEKKRDYKEKKRKRKEVAIEQPKKKRGRPKKIA